MLKQEPAKAINLGQLFASGKAQASNQARHQNTLSPLQKLCYEWRLSSDRPHFFILEDVTGSGKTEAAFLLTHKLMSKGLGQGVFFALPTMATANSMYERLQQPYKQLFRLNLHKPPSLVLAHSKRDMVEGFQNTIVSDHLCNADEQNYDVGANPLNQLAAHNLTATAHCNLWLADNRKKALLADVGVGTIDQALLSVLPSRHQALRLLGLMNKILVIDEVHACDEYMQELLKTLLTAQSYVGGSVILLSATLSKDQKQSLIDAYAQPCKQMNPNLDTTLRQPGYPLVTCLNSFGVKEKVTSTRQGRSRMVKVDFFHDSPKLTPPKNISVPEEDVLPLRISKSGGASSQDGGRISGAAPPFSKRMIDMIRQKLQHNCCVCWVRNTVYDAVEAYNYFQSENFHVNLFHARYALGDRLEKEKEVLKCFGKNSTANTRSRRLLIATQVVEQSLDLDFDVLISDLAPVDLLLQRAGRLHRHARNLQGQLTQGSDERGEACLYVYGPQAQDEDPADWYTRFFPKAGRVYESHAQLWLSSFLLQKKRRICVPQDFRDFIEGVYSGKTLKIEGQDCQIPSALELQRDRVEGQKKASRAYARWGQLDLSSGYKKSGTRWADEAFSPTRLSEPTVTVYLARGCDKSLVPWFYERATDLSSTALSKGDERFSFDNRDIGEAFDRLQLKQKHHYWQLSSLSLRAHYADSAHYLENCEAVIQSFLGPCIIKGEIEKCLQSLPDKGRWSVLLPLVCKDGGWFGSTRGAGGQQHNFEYCCHRGLVRLNKSRA